MYYAGIGSRKTPSDVLVEMRQIATRLGDIGWTLRSGGAQGADSAFAAGASLGDRPARIFTAHGPIPEWALQTVRDYHPNPSACSPFVRKLHARNAMILLGADGRSPVKFVVCWTPNGEATGGTGQGLRIAAAYGIPVFNLAVCIDGPWLWGPADLARIADGSFHGRPLTMKDLYEAGELEGVE